MSQMREPKSMGRPREFDADKVLSQIMDVFWAKGFDGASMNDIVAATGLKKGSLYAAFGDKRAMYLKALALYDRTFIERSTELLEGRGSAKTRIGRFLQVAIDAVAVDADRRGCFLCNASIDQAADDPATRRMVQRSFKRLGRALENRLTEHSTALRDHERRHAQAQHLLSVYFGLRVLAKGGHPVRSLKAAKDAALHAALPPR